WRRAKELFVDVSLGSGSGQRRDKEGRQLGDYGSSTAAPSRTGVVQNESSDLRALSAKETMRLLQSERWTARTPRVVGMRDLTSLTPSQGHIDTGAKALRAQRRSIPHKQARNIWRGLLTEATSSVAM